MFSDLAKVGSDVTALIPGGTSWGWQQWVILAYFLFMIGEYAWAIYENKWPKAKPSHIFFLIVTVVMTAVLWTSGFWK